MNDHSQGGTSLADGTFQIMLNRRIKAKDDKGMGEWLDEIDPGS